MARASLHELREDYRDYLISHRLPLWNSRHARYADMVRYCRGHNDYNDYKELAGKISDEEFANMALTLCHQTDVMMTSYLAHLDKSFVTEGGIKERMHAARTGYRKEQDARLHALEEENLRLKAEIATLKELLASRPS